MSLCIRILLAAAVGASFASPDAARAADNCAGKSACTETRTFVAHVTGFRTSKQGRVRVLTATVSFANKTDKPLAIGYVRNTGIALDDQGNRYAVPGPQAVRAIGEIAGNTFDPKFTLAPGEARDARFELVWDPGRAIIGTIYDLDLTVREIDPVGADQFRLGQEHALQFARLGEAAPPPAVAAAPKPASPTKTSGTDAGASAPAAATAAAAPAAPVDPCGGSPRCYNAGAFIAEVMQVTASAMTPGARHQTVKLNVRFRNVSDRPVILAYHSGSSTGTDNFGNTYYYGRAGTHDTSVQGIGMVTGRSADPQFVLSPGQARSATFNVVRFNAAPPIGEAWNYDVTIDELEILPGQQIRTLRQNAVGFANLRAGSFPGVLAAGAAADAGAAVAPADAAEVANKVVDLFKKIKKKD